MAEMLILGEISEGRLDPITGELIAAARSLGCRVVVALLGDNLDGLSGEAIALGADRVCLVQHPLLAEPSADILVAAFEQVCRQTSPAVVLVGKTYYGRDVGPRVAFRLGAAVANDCVALGLDDDTGRVIATRPVYGGGAVANVTFGEFDPQVIIIRPKVYDQPEADPTRTGEVVSIDVQLEPSMEKVKHVETVQQAAEGVRLEDAAVVVSGGRGLGGPEPFKVLEELAQLLGGAVGASRAPCDAGWIDHGYQVGLTGKTVSPDLYITIGISGASQHLAGCSGAKNIVAVNRDRDANIFREASFGVVGDWKAVLPSFIETVRELIQG